MEWFLGLVSNVLATVIGVVVGIPVAFWLDRRITRSRRNEDTAGTMKSLLHSVRKNQVLLEQLIRELPRAALTAGLDLLPLQILSAKAMDLVGGPLSEQVSGLHFELEIIQKRLRFLQESYAADSGLTGNFAFFANQLRSDLTLFLPKIQGVETLLSIEIAKLRPIKQ